MNPNPTNLSVIAEMALAAAGNETEEIEMSDTNTPAVIAEPEICPDCGLPGCGCPVDESAWDAHVAEVEKAFLESEEAEELSAWLNDPATDERHIAAYYAALDAGLEL